MKTVNEPQPPTIALCVMVKNERNTLPRLFESVRGLVTRAIILDTGSTDGTVKFARDYDGFPVEFHFADFENFGATRTRLLALAKGKADWLLTLDADHTLKWDSSALQPLNPAVPAYALMHDEGTRYWIPRLLRGDRDWSYVGVTHEYLDTAPAPQLYGITVLHHADGGSRADKFERDLRLLLNSYREDPSNARTCFYLANTFRDLGKPIMATVYYRERIALGGWSEEIFVSMLELAKLTENPIDFWQAWAFRPTRAEPFYYLGMLHRARGETELERSVWWLWEKIKVPAGDRLFVETRCYAPAE